VQIGEKGSLLLDYNLGMTSSAKKHFYAVVKGRKPGLYTHWTGAGGAEEQIKGFAGAIFRGFTTREEAEYYLRSKGQVMPAQPLLLDAEPAGVNEPTLLTPPPTYLPDLQAGRLVIFTDGASTGNPGPGGYGVVMLYGEKRKELSGGFRCTTNNRMELMGVIAALQTLKRRSEVVVYTDSRYVVNAVALGWARRWKARGWMRDSENRAENADLWSTLLDLLDQHAVDFRWVKGHASNPENERCDYLAVQAAHKRNLPPDPGFAGKC
jgi:ribonuclease HI